MAKAFASQGDMTVKKITFTKLGKGVYAFTAEGDPNSGVIIGDDSANEHPLCSILQGRRGDAPAALRSSEGGMGAGASAAG